MVIRCLLLSLALLGASLRPLGAQSMLAEEADVEAAFVYKFAKFIEWPGQKRGDGPLVIGVLGDSAVEGALNRIRAQAKVGGYPVEVRVLRNLDGIGGCHIVFVSSSESGRLKDVLDKAVAGNVLAVSDMARFVERGGMIGLEREEARIRFAINSVTASRAGLKISSQLLKIAHHIIDETFLRHDHFLAQRSLPRPRA